MINHFFIFKKRIAGDMINPENIVEINVHKYDYFKYISTTT